MFKLYWSHIHDLHAIQKQQWRCAFMDNKNTTHIGINFLSFLFCLLYLGQLVQAAVSIKNCKIATGIEC